MWVQRYQTWGLAVASNQDEGSRASGALVGSHRSRDVMGGERGRRSRGGGDGRAGFQRGLHKNPPRERGGGREEGWGRLRRPASCPPAASHLPPMGDASVPTPLLTSPAPTNVTICLKKPTVERGSVP